MNIQTDMCDLRGSGRMNELTSPAFASRMCVPSFRKGGLGNAADGRWHEGTLLSKEHVSC